MIPQEFSENICNSHDRPAEGTLAMTGQNEQHTFLGLDGVPRRSSLWKSGRLVPGVIYAELCQGTLASILMGCC